MSKIIFLIAILFSMNTTAQVHKKIPVSLKWEKAATLPPSKGQAKSIGFAGPINGVSDGVFITAGGANFPNKMPWEGGAKYYSNEIYVLTKEGNNLTWIDHDQTLPEPVAYCGVTSTKKGIVCVGGENAAGLSKKAFLLNWDKNAKKAVITSLPDLPEPLTNVAVAHIENMVYIAGGDEKDTSTNQFLRLDLQEENAHWNKLPDLPFELANASLIAQGKNLYMIGGRTKSKTGISQLHGTTFVYNTEKNTWKKLADICDGKNPAMLSAAAGILLDKQYILMIGGDDGKTFHKIETLLSQISKASSEAEKQKLTKEKNILVINHKGFSKKLLLYNIPSNCWTEIGEYPYPAQVTTAAVHWDGKIMMSNGEIKPGVRTPDVIEGWRVKQL